MTLDAVSFVPDGTETIRFDISYDGISPYQVKKITGLDADEIIPKFYGFSTNGQQRFFDGGLKTRFVVILLQLNPRFNLGEDYKYLRDQLYKRILPTRIGTTTLQFHEGGATIAGLTGFVTKFEADLFAKTPTVQITLRCNDPMFRALVQTGAPAADISSAGETIVVTDSTSTAPHGGIFQFTASSSTTNTVFTLHDFLTVSPFMNWSFQLVPDAAFLSGDVLTISSEFNNKYITLLRSGVTTYLMDSVVVNSIWPVIFPGPNTFMNTEHTKWTWTSIKYTPAFWGL